MKKITDALADFSKKLSRFEQAEEKEFIKPVSKDAPLQKKINLTEEEKIERIKAEYEKYINPVSKEIEEDEEAVLSALRIFKAARVAEQTEVSSKKVKNRLPFISWILNLLYARSRNMFTEKI